MHYNAAELLDGEIAGFYIAEAENHPSTVGFWIEYREPGRPAKNFSYRKCTKKGGDTSRAGKLQRAARVAVQQQLWDYKAQLQTDATRCEECGSLIDQETMLDHQKVHIDHKSPLVDVFGEFRRQHDTLSLAVIKVEHEMAEYRFENRETESLWEQFHLVHATLQPLHAVCHRKKTTKDIQSCAAW